MGVRAVLVGLLALAPGVASHMAPRTLKYPIPTFTPGASRAASTPHAASSCCFIVQDTIYEEWWDIYSVSTIYEPIKLTSITTLITPYPNSTVTNYETNIYPTSASSLYTAQKGQDPIKLYANNAPGPVEIDQALSSLNGTQIVTAGVTVNSPAAFWAYSTVKVINVPAVTDSNGHVVCATSSALGYDVTNPQDFTTFSGINSNAEAYFGGYDIGLPAGVARNLSSPRHSGVTITFPTPYIYEPARGANGEDTGFDQYGCWSHGSMGDYGYVPSSVIKYVTDHPDISSQYPGIASCLAGGPSILSVSGCADAAPDINFLATDLTEHTVVTVGGVGGLVAAPASAPPSGPVTTAIAAGQDIPIQQSQVQAFTPAQTPPASAQAVPPGTAVNAVAASAVVPPGPQAPAGQTSVAVAGNNIQPAPQPPAASPAGQTSVAVAGNNIQPAPQPPAAQTSVAVAGTIIQPGLQLPATQPSGAAAVPAPSSLIITGPTTIPVNPAIPLPGSTTVISGTPFVIISTPTTILIPANTIPTIALPSGQTTTISGTPVVIISGVQTIPVNSAFSISGATTVVGGVTTIISGTPTVVGGTTEVVASGTQTVALPTNVPGTGSPSKPAQLTGMATRGYGLGRWWCIFLGLGFWFVV